MAVVCSHGYLCTRQHFVVLANILLTGKSSLTVQYVDGHFVDSYYPTIENTFSKVIRYRNQDFAVEMIDTAGQDEYSILNSKHFIGIHGYMIVYSVGSKQSFEMVRIIRDKILNHLVGSPVLHAFLHSQDRHPNNIEECKVWSLTHVHRAQTQSPSSS